MVRNAAVTDADVFIAQHIGPHPAKSGLDEYWLKEPGIPVWAIIGSLEANGGREDDVVALYGILHEEVEAAWAFYARHRAVIDNRLAKNDAD